jgi:ketosteroid isomerase-like protein
MTSDSATRSTATRGAAAPSETETEIRAAGARWAQAESAGDVHTLDELSAAEFRLVGPFGFVLDKAQWLERYSSGDLVTSSLVWDEVDVRDLGAAAIAIGRQSQQATYRDRPADGQFRVTQVFVRDNGRWLLAGLHLSHATPPAPPS